MTTSAYADLVILNGNIITMSPASPEARAIAVKFGRILAVGGDDEMGPLIGTNTQVINAGDKTVIPGLNDAHCHGMSAARQAIQVDCGPNAVSSISDVKKAVAERCKRTLAGQWICGYGYDDTKLTEKRLLTRSDIDEVAPDHPVWVRHVSGHIGMTNSLALEAAKLTGSSPDPVGGKYGRDRATGELNGV
jgi:predicted amidohydrolase YtcJ